ncbi:MAG: BMP family ABC transporter substrate-binding protein [Lachnospiraceae bacterium]|nr:BMP family ABC transporter substrate-binding protein [Lachnospiraceae bacterium]
MKKTIAMLLNVILLSVLLAACGGGTQPAGGGASSAGDASTGAAEAGASAAVETSTEAVEAADLKVGLICLHDENSTYDNNFIKAFEESCAKLGVEYVIKPNVPEGQECYEEAANLADAGCSIIFADSFGHEDYMIQAAKEFPDVQFCHATGTKAHTENLPNYHNAFAAIYEGRYLAGVAAGMKLNEMKEAGQLKGDAPKMGYVGAFTYAEVISGYTSFYLGAKSVCPDVTMDVTFTGSWYDETAEKEGANKLIQGGCDLISQHADSMGAPTACQDAGVPNVSYNGSTLSVGKDTYIVSSRINWSPYYEYCIQQVQAGAAIDTDWTGTIDSGSVALTELNEAVVAEGTQAKIDEVTEGLKNGTIHVFDTSAFTVDGQTLDSYMADVDTDADYTPDTEVVTDGYFHESEFRSAPYFDLSIDGIVRLDESF